VTCREFADFIADYLSGALAAETLATFEHHLTRCPNCRTYLAGYEATIKLSKRAFDDDTADVPNDVPADLVNAILAARRRTS
jgi:anti-sigma factor RsiW